jgi:hypothetical protein
MESDKNIIIQNFFQQGQSLINSPYMEKLKPIRLDYEQEISKPGCTPCIINAAKRKYSDRINAVLAENLTSEGNPPDSFDPFNNVPMP